MKTNPQEKRRHRRYPYPQNPHVVDTTVLATSADGIGPHDLHFINFSRSGLGFRAPHKVPVGTELQLALSVDGEAPVRLKAVVCNCRKEDGAYYFGAYFEYDAAAHPVHQTLNRAERNLQTSFCW